MKQVRKVLPHEYRIELYPRHSAIVESMYVVYIADYPVGYIISPYFDFVNGGYCYTAYNHHGIARTVFHGVANNSSASRTAVLTRLVRANKVSPHAIFISCSPNKPHMSSHHCAYYHVFQWAFKPMYITRNRFDVIRYNS